jgi:hypothetical protein
MRRPILHSFTKWELTENNMQMASSRSTPVSRESTALVRASEGREASELAASCTTTGVEIARSETGNNKASENGKFLFKSTRGRGGLVRYRRALLGSEAIVPQPAPITCELWAAGKSGCPSAQPLSIACSGPATIFYFRTSFLSSCC